jgi:translation initiation factor 3 subunit J
LKQQEKDADLANAADLFGGMGVTKRSAKPVTIEDPKGDGNLIDLSSLPIFHAKTKDQFTKLKDTLVPLLGANVKEAHYAIFLQEFTKLLAKDLPSDQIKKIASGLTTLSNEKMKEEKLAEKGGKKSKAAKTKVTLNATRDISYKADTSVYDGGLEE